MLPQSCLLGVGGPSSAGGVPASSEGGSLVSPWPVDESLNTEPLRSESSSSDRFLMPVSGWINQSHLWLIEYTLWCYIMRLNCSIHPVKLIYRCQEICLSGKM